MIRLPVLNSEKSKASCWQYLFFSQGVLHNKKRLTQRALDAGESALFHLCLRHGAGKHFSLACPARTGWLRVFLSPNRVHAPPSVQ